MLQPVYGVRAATHTFASHTPPRVGEDFATQLKLSQPLLPSQQCCRACTVTKTDKTLYKNTSTAGTHARDAPHSGSRVEPGIAAAQPEPSPVGALLPQKLPLLAVMQNVAGLFEPCR